MTKQPNIIQEVQAYCEAVGIAPTTLGLRVLNNARFFERLAKRQKMDAQAVQNLRAYMASNPAPQQTEGAAQ